MSEKSEDGNSEIQTGYLIPVAISFVLFVSSIPYFISSNSTQAQTHFEYVTSFFAGLAFVGVLLTLIIQKKELDETRNVMKQQEFKAAFFNMLAILDKVSAGLKTGFHTNPFIGKYFFIELERQLSGYLENHKNEKFNDLEVENALKSFFEEHITELEHYHRILFRIMQYLSSNDLDKDFEKVCAQFLESSLSSSERILLFYFSITESGKYFRVFIHRLNLFPLSSEFYNQKDAFIYNRFNLSPSDTTSLPSQ